MNLAALSGDLRDQIDDRPGVELIGLMTMVVIAINTSHDPPLFLGALAALTVSVMRPGLFHGWWWWAAIAVVLGIRTLMAWEGVDNHVVLTTYWTMAVALALLSRAPIETMARSGRWLVGLVFAFATYWKVAVPEFRRGEFFEFTLLIDDRFRTLATTLGGLSGEEHRANLASFAEIGRLEGTPAVVELVSTDAIATVAVVLTIGTIVVEAAVAGAYLAPLSPLWRWLRPAVLVAFCVLTYLIVPVGGFGLALVVMTMADPALTGRWRRTLAVLFVAVAAYAPVWQLVAA